MGLRLNVKVKPVWIKKLNGFHAIAWAILIIPSMLWWKDSVPWVVFLSVWANFVTALGTWVASRAEVQAETTENS